jgi:hypothetical protein
VFVLGENEGVGGFGFVVEVVVDLELVQLRLLFGQQHLQLVVLDLHLFHLPQSLFILPLRLDQRLQLLDRQRLIVLQLG